MHQLVVVLVVVVTLPLMEPSQLRLSPLLWRPAPAAAVDGRPAPPPTPAAPLPDEAAAVEGRLLAWLLLAALLATLVTLLCVRKPLLLALLPASPKAPRNFASSGCNPPGAAPGDPGAPAAAAAAAAKAWMPDRPEAPPDVAAAVVGRGRGLGHPLGVGGPPAAACWAAVCSCCSLRTNTSKSLLCKTTTVAASTTAATAAVCVREA